MEILSEIRPGRCADRNILFWADNDEMLMPPNFMRKYVEFWWRKKNEINVYRRLKRCTNNNAITIWIRKILREYFECGNRWKRRESGAEGTNKNTKKKRGRIKKKDVKSIHVYIYRDVSRAKSRESVQVQHPEQRAPVQPASLAAKESRERGTRASSLTQVKHGVVHIKMRERERVRDSKRKTGER